jgi:hypothetical protein
MFWSRLGWGETEGHPVLIGAGAFLIVRLSTRFRRSPVARRAFLSSLPNGHAGILPDLRIILPWGELSMNKDWDKLAEDRFKHESALARSGSRFTLSVIMGVVVAAVFALIDAVKWFFFGRAVSKEELWGLLILIVVFPILDRVFTPMMEARTMQAKRAIRIEAKLDYLLSKHSEE